MAATLLAGTQAPATAGVIPDDLLFKILDETPKLERSPSDEPKTRSYKVIGTDVRGYINPDIDDYGFLKNGQDLLIVPFASGGSGGVFDALLFTGVKTDKPRFIGYVPSPNGHLEIGISEGRLIVSTPNYGPGDSSCCPSSRDIITYAIDGITMTKLSSRTAREPALGRGR
jgi:hypothetical protein